MKLQVLRFSSGSDSTNGLLLDVTEGVKFLAYTLEDEYRKEKKSKETRIPAGTYEIKLRDEGGFHQKYSKRYPNMHRGMLHIIDVPNFEYILIHTGNTDEHTAGCLLVGDSQQNNQVTKDGFIGSSNNAYKRIYPSIAKAIGNLELVTIEYIDLN
jgi:hypothetical protein|tara:strand:- start:963 stop:1427 length:465 start_codon:yes stop_codon:yes gene_type:complete